METWVGRLCLLTQPKEEQRQIWKQKQPELTENQTVWKSDNQGDKEETLTQTSRRGGARQLGREDSQQGGGWRTGWGGCWQSRQFHICMQISREEQLMSKSDPKPRVRHRETKPQTTDWKHLWGSRQQEKLPASQESLLERLTGTWNEHKPTHLGISTRRAHFDCG